MDKTSEIINIIFIGPFLIAMSYYPQPTLMKVVAGILILLSLGGFLVNIAGATPKLPSLTPSYGQTKTEYSIRGIGGSGEKRFPNAVDIAY